MHASIKISLRKYIFRIKLSKYFRALVDCAFSQPSGKLSKYIWGPDFSADNGLIGDKSGSDQLFNQNYIFNSQY